MKKIVPNIGSRFTFTFSSINIPEKVPEEAVTHKLNKDRIFEIELFNSAEMRNLRNSFRRNLSRRGVSARNEEIDEVFETVMKKIGQKIDKDFQKKGVGHVIGEDRHFGDGRDSEEWFYVIDWPGGRKVREQFGFDDADFHVTLGLTGNGVDRIRKDETTLLDDEGLDYREGGLTKLFVNEERLTELGETTEGYEWSTEKPGEQFKFYTENHEYYVYANRKNPRALDISFGLSFEQAGMQRFDTVTNEKNMFKIVATVIDVAKHVWKHRETFYRDGEMIEYIEFDGNPKNDEKRTKDTVRNKLYLNFINNQFPRAEISHFRKNVYRVYP